MVRNYDALARRALGAAFACIIVAIPLMGVTWQQLHHGERALASGQTHVAEVTLVIGRTLADLAMWSLAMAAAFVFAMGACAVFDARRREAHQQGVSHDRQSVFEQSLNDLVTSLGEMEAEFRTTERALATVEAERRRNEVLVSVTRVQAEAVRDEIRDAAATGNRFQTRLALAGIALTTLLSVVIALIQRRSG